MDEEFFATAHPVDESWAVLYRVDLATGEVSSTRETSIGGLRARANLTRTGVFVYRQGDGSTRREYRPADEVFDRDSLDSLAHVPLTVGHPQKVTPDNWAKLSKGHVGERPHRSGKFVSSDIHIEDRGAAADAKSEKLKELSCGYTCHFDPTPGISPEGEAYDGIMRRIRYNHVALLPEGYGRAGPDVRMHLDASDGVSGESSSPTYVREVNEEPTGDQPPMAMTPEEQRAFDTALREARENKSRADAADELAKTEKARADKADAAAVSLGAEKKTLAGQVERLEQASQHSDAEEELERRVDATVNARSDAREVFASKEDPTGSKWKHDGKTVEDIRREVVTHLEPEMKDDVAEMKGDALDGVYALAMRHFRKVRSAGTSLRNAATAPRRGESRARGNGEGAGERGDAMPDDDEDVSAEDARKKMDKKKRDAAKKKADRGGRSC